MIITQVVDTPARQRAEAVEFQGRLHLTPGWTLRRTLSLVIYRAFGRLPQCFLQSPPWGVIIFNRAKHFPPSSALST
jgi:hypothetical protein